MRQTDLLAPFLFMVGLIYGFFLQMLIFNYLSQHLIKIKEVKLKLHEKCSDYFYEHELADKLYNEVKILCWIITHPSNHKTKVREVRRTWGPRCNKLLFMSVETDPEYPDIIALPIENGRKHFWNKTKLAMKYIKEHFANDFDFFLRADDDNYIIMENVRHMLYQHRPSTALYIGCRYVLQPGGGHIYSRKALIKFVDLLEKDQKNCRSEDEEHEDLYTGKCLKYKALFLDDVDESGQKRFFTTGIEKHFAKKVSADFYWDLLWTNSTQGSLDCCSDTFVSLTPVRPSEMHLLDYFIYRVHPFGLEKNLTETLPRKFSFNKVLKMSKKQSPSIYYKPHNVTHFLDDDERY